MALCVNIMKIRWILLCGLFLALYVGPASSIETDDLVEECGLTGSIEERVSECALYKNYDGYEFGRVDLDEREIWALVMRVKGHKTGFLHFWQDRASKLIWADPFNETMTSGDAYEACDAYENDRNVAVGRLSRNWRVPSDSHIETAWPNQIGNVLDMAGPASDFLWWIAPNSGLSAIFNADPDAGRYWPVTAEEERDQRRREEGNKEIEVAARCVSSVALGY